MYMVSSRAWSSCGHEMPLGLVSTVLAMVLVPLGLGPRASET